jgi:glycosyltransferase involved in cell wall biosynthesis
MNLASWIVATHYRPQLLRACVESLRDQVYPTGWRSEIIVAHHELDTEGASIARELGVFTVATRSSTGGGKRNAALQVASGKLVLVADDDDHQSPYRAKAAISAFCRGHAISELREFRYLHLDTGQIVRWCGRGNDGRPPVIVGTARNYRRSLLASVGGWKRLPRMIEKDIQARIYARHPGKTGRAYDLGA